MYFHLSRVQIDAGHYADADISLGKAQDLLEELEFKLEVGLMHLARGVVLSRADDTAAARTHLDQALAIFEDGPNRYEWANALMEMGRLERIEGNVEAATTTLERSLELVGEDGPPRYLAWASRELAHTLMQSDPTLAEKHALQAIELFRQASQPIEVARTNLLLCSLKGQQQETAAVLAHVSAASAALEAAAEL
jgi:tetratricopeptide (TPR) repeat protein